MSTPPSATRLVQSLLSTHPHLSTQQIFKLATDNLRPTLRPAHVITNDGRIRMKRMSNMREGKRPWVPMPSAPFPDHPFKSVNFLKNTVLASLESQGLIHLARIETPISTEEQRQEALANAMRLTRKAERRAMRLNEPMPPARIPKTTVTSYAWKMGPRPQQTLEDRQEEEDVRDLEEEEDEKSKELAKRMYDTWSASRGQLLPQYQEASSSSSTTIDQSQADVKARWDQADKLEAAYVRAREMEAQQILKRKAARSLAYKEEKERLRREKAEDIAMGRTEAVIAERKRRQALEAIENYARQTGEDVSNWYAELGQGEGDDLPASQETANGRKRSGFGLR